MNKLVIVIVIGLIGASIATYFVYAQISNSPVVVTKDGIQAQVVSCTKTPDNQFLIGVQLKHVASGHAWNGTVALMRDGREWGSFNLHSNEGFYGSWLSSSNTNSTVSVPIYIPLI